MPATTHGQRQRPRHHAAARQEPRRLIQARDDRHFLPTSCEVARVVFLVQALFRQRVLCDGRFHSYIRPWATCEKPGDRPHPNIEFQGRGIVDTSRPELAAWPFAGCRRGAEGLPIPRPERAPSQAASPETGLPLACLVHYQRSSHTTFEASRVLDCVDADVCMYVCSIAGMLCHRSLPSGEG